MKPEDASAKLAIGTAQFGLDYGIANESGLVNESEAASILSLAKTFNMDTLDTAIAYGESEAMLGHLGVQQWKVVTKLPPVPGECQHIESWVNAQVRNSLSRLGVTQLYGLLLHCPAQLLGNKGSELYAALQMTKGQGLAQKVGISIYEPDELSLLLEQYTFDLIQSPLSIWDRRLVETGWARQLHNLGVEIHARSIFLQGLLLLPKGRRPRKFEPWAERWAEWDRWLAETHLSALEACLKYVTACADVSRVLVGIQSEAQLLQIQSAISGSLPSLPDLQSLEDKRIIDPRSWNQL